MGHELLDEHRAMTPTIGRFPPDIKPEVYLIEAPVTRHRHAEDSEMQELKADQADVMAILPAIELQSTRQYRLKHRGFNDEIQDRQMTPLGAKKGPDTVHAEPAAAFAALPAACSHGSGRDGTAATLPCSAGPSSIHFTLRIAAASRCPSRCRQAASHTPDTGRF